MTALRSLILLFALIATPSFAQNAAAPRPATSDTILLLPFEPLNDATNTPWIGRAVQQTILAELGDLRNVHPITTRDPAPSDIAQAREAGRKANASVVIAGSYQSTDDTVRLTGHVIDVETGRLLGGLKTTGPLRDLFALQDDIAAQAYDIVARHQLNQRPTPAAAPTTQPTPQTIHIVVQNPQPPLRDIDLDYFDRHLNYNYANTYPPYDYRDSHYRHRYGYPSYYYPYRPVYYPNIPNRNPPIIHGPTNVGGTISIGGSRGSGYIPPTIGRSVGRY